MAKPRGIEEKPHRSPSIPRASDDLGIADLERLRRKIRGMRREAGDPLRSTTASKRPKSLKTCPAACSSQAMARPPVLFSKLEDRGEPLPLGEAVAGTEVLSPEGLAAYLVQTRLGGLGEPLLKLEAELLAEAVRSGSGLALRLAELLPDATHAVTDLMFLDLETTGLGSTPLFLIGLMVWDDGGLVVRQYFARGYSEEPAVLRLFLHDARDRKALVSFNGKAFDLPYLRMRAAATAVPFVLEPAHLDLLHESRRVWGEAVPDCKLQTLESLICGRARDADLSGSDIPDAYHEFVRTGDARRIADILRHNFLDLVTMAELLVRLPPPA